MYSEALHAYTRWSRRDRMVVGFITTYTISADHHKRCDFESRSGEVYSIRHYVITKFVSALQQVCGFPTGTLVSSTNKTDCDNITEILLKVGLNIITLSLTHSNNARIKLDIKDHLILDTKILHWQTMYSKYMFLIKKNQQQTVRFCELIYKYLSRKFKLVN